MLAWLARHPRFTFHFTPTSCSWLNAVETFFATLTKRRLKRGVFRSVVDLQAAINRYLDEANHLGSLVVCRVVLQEFGFWQQLRPPF